MLDGLETASIEMEKAKVSPTMALGLNYLCTKYVDNHI